MFALSRWSGGLVGRAGSRLPLTAGPCVAAGGFALYMLPGIGGSYWTTFFPAIVTLGVGMAITVAPLTATVMGAVDATHAGAASGVNNAVSRVAGLLAIAVFGVLFAHTFEVRAGSRIDRLGLPIAVRQEVENRLPQIAAIDVDRVEGLSPPARRQIRTIVDEEFVFAFRLVMIGATFLGLTAAAVGSAIRES
jgi:hypothetical protein